MATANLNFSLGSHCPQAAKVCHGPCSISVLRQAIHKLVLSVAPGGIRYAVHHFSSPERSWLLGVFNSQLCAGLGEGAMATLPFLFLLA